MTENFPVIVGNGLRGRLGSDWFTKLSFESGYKFRVPLDAIVSVEGVVTRKSNTIRNFPCTVLQSPVVLTSSKASLVSATVPTLKQPRTEPKPELNNAVGAGVLETSVVPLTEGQ